MPRKASINELSINEFRLLLQDEEFLDFFNKFCCLPAFSQLVVYSKSRKEFLFEPSFRSDQYKLNKRGMLKWLWKRCSLFVKTRWFVNFLLAKCLMENKLFQNVHEDLFSSDEKTIRHSLTWLAKKSFGRVSGLRRFRRFLMKTADGYKMYRFWLETERLYQYIKQKSCTSIKRLNKLKSTFFRECGDLAFPRHLIDAAWATFGDGLALSELSERSFDLTFTMRMQKLCMHRLCTYWTPRYLLSCTIQTDCPSDEANYELAMRYLKKTFPEDFLTNGLENYPGILPQTSPPGGAIVHDFDEMIMGSRDCHNLNNRSDFKDNKLSLQAHKSSWQRRPRSYAGPGDKQSTLSDVRSASVNTSEEGMFKEEDQMDSSNKVRKRASTAPSGNDGDESVFSNEKNMEQFHDNESHEEDDASLTSIGSDDSIKKKKVRRPNKKYARRRTEDLTKKFKEVLQNSSSKRQTTTDDVKQETRKRSTVETLKIVDDMVENEVEARKSAESGSGSRTLSDQKSEIKAIRESQEEFLDGTTTSQHEVDTDEDKSRRRSSVDEQKLESEILQERSSTRPRTSQNLEESPCEVPKKRKTSFRPRLKRTKVTTLTFTLSGKTEKRKRHSPQTNVKMSSKSRPRRSYPKLADQTKSDLNQLVKTMKKKSANRLQSSLRLEAGDPVFSFQEDFECRKASENRRMIAALQTDHAAGNPFHRFLANSDNQEMYDLLTFWQDVEKSRSDYKFGSMTFAEFSKSLNTIVTNHLLPTSPFHIDAPESITKSIVSEVLSCEPYEMPWELRKLQTDALEELKSSYEAYTAQDVQSFYNTAADNIDEEPRMLSRLSKFKKRRLSSTYLSPILSKEQLTRSFSGMEMEKDPLKKEMIRRMYRAQQLVIEEHLPSGRKQFLPEEQEDSDLSDDDGHPKSPPPPLIIRKPPVNMKELAALSAIEYPNLNETCRLIAMRERRFQRRSANYYKPIKRGGLILRRPLNRPISFNEVLKDIVHLEFFKRYLKAYRSETPMQFWIAVEALKGADNTKNRQKKAKQIIKRYFHSNKGPATKLLQCQADVIKEIPYLDMVTTGMLFVAQTAVAKSLEADWFRKYASTFPDVVPPKIASDVSNAPETPKMTKKLDNESLKGPWGVFRSFIKRSAMFLHHMKEQRFVDMFSEFLKREAACDDSIIASDDKRNLDVKAKRSGLLPNLYLEPEREKKKVRQKIVNRQLITLNFLEDDFKFWQEIQRYKLLAENCSLHDPRGNTRLEDVKLLKRKAQLIIKCFLESNISPETRVNLPTEVCDITTDSLQNGMLDASLFHEATIYIFPLMVVFWKKFCEERYKYTPQLSKRQLKIYGNKYRPAATEAMAKKNKLQKEERRKRDNPADFALEESFYSNQYFPDYENMEPADFKKLRGSARDADDLGSRVTFSIRMGPCLVQSGRGRKSTVIKPESPDVRFVIESGLSTSKDQRKSISHLSRRPSKVITPKSNTKRLGFANLSATNEINPGIRLPMK